MPQQVLSIKGTFDGSELVKGFTEVSEQVGVLEDAGDSAKKSLDKMLQQKNATTNYKRQLGQITAELTDLSVNYSRLTEAEKKTDFGRAMCARIDELTAEAQELKGVMDDVTLSLKGAAAVEPPDFGAEWAEVQRQTEQTRAKFEGLQKMATGVASGFAAVQGAAALLGKENENLQEALLKVQAAMAIAQGIGGLKDLIEGIDQAKLAFKGFGKQIAAVSKSMGKAGWLGVILAVTAAVIGIVKAVKDHRKEVQGLSSDIKKYNEAAKEEIGKAGELIAELTIYEKIATDVEESYENRKIAAEKALEFLGEEINETTTAAMINGQYADEIDKVTLALINKAKAEAAYGIIIQKYNEAFAKRAELQAESKELMEEAAEVASKGPSLGNVLTSSIISAEGVQMGNGQVGLTPEQAKNNRVEHLTNKAEKLKKQADAIVDDLDAWADSFIKELDIDLTPAIAGKPTIKTGGTSTSSSSSTPEVVRDFVKLEPITSIDTKGIAQEAIKTIQDELNAATGLAIKVELDEDDFETRMQAIMDKTAAANEVIGTLSSVLGTVVSAINDENTALGAATQGMEESTKAWTEWGINSLSMVSQVLPEIAALIVANQAKAIAEGTASGAGLPFPANIAAIASILATVVAIFATLPKFASGGIVGGSSKIGDFNLARVNAGEMVLNNRQQANLFRLLNENRVESSINDGIVDFRIQGDTLVGVIENYNKKRARI